jgi:DNA-binding response OmpR family regulator
MYDLKILIVDDEEDFVTTLAERLELRGLQVQIALDGESAVSHIVGDDAPHVVILDLLMPGLSGIAVLRRIRSQKPAIPVILLTGRGSIKDGIEGMRSGAFDYLMKPVDIEKLIEKIREAVKGSNRASIV